MSRTLGYVAIVGGFGVLLYALYALAGRDYVGAALLMVAFVSLSHLGLELLARAAAELPPESEVP